MDLSTQILLKNALQHIHANELNLARELLLKAESTSPNNPEILRFFSVVSALQFDFKSALEQIDQVILLDPDNGIAHSNRGNILKELKRYEEALTSLDRAIKLLPEYAEAHNNKGNTLQDLYEYEAALKCYDKAIELWPNYAEAYSNKGNALELLGRYSEAMESYDNATAINPQYADAYWHKALSQLARGDYENGWQNYEARWFKSHPIKFQYSNIPRLEALDGLVGKKVLVWSEQGLGDTIQFCRYIPKLVELGCRVTFVVPKLLVSLLTSLGSDFDLVEAEVCSSDEFDYQTPLLSLPLLFRTTVNTVPSVIPYLNFDENKKQFFQTRFQEDKDFKVGIVWNGGFRANSPELWSTNERRNIALKQIAELRDVANVSFYSLQKGDPAESELKQMRDLVWPNIINCVQWLQDFTDTAALIESLDLIISVDTSTAHLAGALGKPVWILNRYDSCWRWLRDMQESPWYPSAKIYQQKHPGDWDEVITRVKIDLEKLIHKKVLSI